jgi:hypothetical protein
MNAKITTPRISSLLLGFLRRRCEVGADHFVELLFIDRVVAASSDLLSPLRSRFVSEDDLGSIRELGDIGTTELLDCLLEGRTVHGAESTTGCDHLTSKRGWPSGTVFFLLLVLVATSPLASLSVFLVLGLAFASPSAIALVGLSLVVSQFMYW